MDEQRLKMLIENDLYSLVLANSQDELAKVSIDTVRNAINQFMQIYEEELTVDNIDFLTEYIWTVINKAKNKNNTGKER